jgi:hypothetical protein
VQQRIRKFARQRRHELRQALHRGQAIEPGPSASRAAWSESPAGGGDRSAYSAPAAPIPSPSPEWPLNVPYVPILTFSVCS